MAILLIINSSKKTMLEQLLLDAGLSSKEIAAYLVLLRCGSRPTSFVARKAGLNRGTAWLMLHALVDKGLAAKSVKNRVQTFSALHPEQLVEYVSRRTSQLESVGRRLSEALPEFVSLVSPHASRPKIEFFEGAEGARTVLERTLAAEDKTLRAFLSLGDVADLVGKEFFDAYTTKRIKHGFALKVLRTREKDKAAMAKNAFARRYVTDAKEAREVRYVSEDLAFPITMYVYDERIAVLASKEENFALIIESRELSNMQRKLFELIWASAERA